MRDRYSVFVLPVLGSLLIGLVGCQPYEVADSSGTEMTIGTDPGSRTGRTVLDHRKIAKGMRGVEILGTYKNLTAGERARIAARAQRHFDEAIEAEVRRLKLQPDYKRKRAKIEGRREQIVATAKKDASAGKITKQEEANQIAKAEVETKAQLSQLDLQTTKTAIATVRSKHSARYVQLAAPGGDAGLLADLNLSSGGTVTVGKVAQRTNRKATELAQIRTSDAALANIPPIAISAAR
jgi:hypothetical protein